MEQKIVNIFLASPRGFCAGVDRAVEIVKKTINKFGAPVYVRHEIVHNQFVVENLKSQGAIFVEELSEIKDKSRPVIFSAHGVPKEVINEAKLNNIIYIDATCPLVTKVHREAETLAKEEYNIIFIGHKNHPEVIGTMGQIDNNYITLIEILKRLETEADFPQNITFAQANLMKTYYEQKDYLNAVIYADKVLSNPKTDDKVKSDAQIIIARAAFSSNDLLKARQAYSKLSSIAKGELAAEALYYDAYFKNSDRKFEESNTVVQKLTKDYSGYKYFGAKGLVVMAKNFYGLKDSFQATYILDSVIKNFTSFPDVLEEAQKELDFIKTEEAKTNSSITK